MLPVQSTLSVIPTGLMLVVVVGSTAAVSRTPEGTVLNDISTLEYNKTIEDMYLNHSLECDSTLASKVTSRL